MNIKVLKLALDADERISPDVKEQLLKETEILFEFHEFMKSKHDINDQEAESISKAYVSSRMREGTKAEMAIVMESLATHYGFDKAKEFADSMINLVSLLEPDFE